MRLAMWSGPRNLSTALMYSFGAREDFAVWDEPFYAAHLHATGLDHPMRAAVIAGGETDPEVVAARCVGDIPDGKPHFYLKVMPHHMIDGFPMAWAEACVNVHLIRHPARVIASYSDKWAEVGIDEIGFRQQLECFDRLGGLVVDSADIREHPEGVLEALCAGIGLPFDRAMLRWPAGGHKDDGPWAPHWYGAVHRSTGFAGPEGPLPQLEGRGADLLRSALPYYEALAARKLSLS